MAWLWAATRPPLALPRLLLPSPPSLTSLPPSSLISLSGFGVGTREGAGPSSGHTQSHSRSHSRTPSPHGCPLHSLGHQMWQLFLLTAGPQGRLRPTDTHGRAIVPEHPWASKQGSCLPAREGTGPGNPGLGEEENFPVLVPAVTQVSKLREQSGADPRILEGSGPGWENSDTRSQSLFLRRPPFPHLQGVGGKLCGFPLNILRSGLRYPQPEHRFSWPHFHRLRK